METPPTTRRLPWIDIGAFLLLAVLAALLGNGANRPLEEHEVFVARTATELGRSGDWLLPTFNGHARLEKPAVAYWCALGAHALFDTGDIVSEFAARFSSVLAALALIGVVFELARLAFADRRAGFAAAAVWATSFGALRYAHDARPEMLYALFCGLAMLGFVRLALGAGRAAPNTALAWGGVVLALLTKGPFLPTFIVVGVAVAVWRARRSGATSATVRGVLRPWSGLVLVLVGAGAYYGFVAWSVPHALDFWRSQMFDRTGGTGSAGLAFLTVPYLWSTPPMLVPWLFLVPFAAVCVWRSRALGVRMLGAAIVAALFFLSFSRRSHDYYTLPVIPFACALMGGAAVALFDRWRVSAPQKLVKTLRVHAALALLAALGVVAWKLQRDRALDVGAPLWSTVVFAVLAVVLALFALKDATQAFERSFGLLAASIACAFAAAYVGNVGWEKERFTKAAFALQVAKYLPVQYPLARHAGSLELLVYYGDRAVYDLADGELDLWLAKNPGGIVISRAAELAAGRVKGRALLTEAAKDGRDPMVIIDQRR